MKNRWQYTMSGLSVTLVVALALVVLVGGGVLAQEMQEFRTSGVIIPFAGTEVPYDEEAVYRWTMSPPEVTVGEPQHNSEDTSSTWPFRVDLIVHTDEAPPIAWPVELDVDFSQWLDALAVAGAINPASLRLVAHGEEGPIDIPVQFASSNADQPGQQGQLVWVIDEKTGKQFSLYFDTDAGSSVSATAHSDAAGALQGDLDNLVIRNDHLRAVLLDQSGFLGPVYLRDGDEQIPVISWDAIWLALDNNWWGPWEAFGRYDFTDEGPSRIVTRAQVNGRIDGRRIQVVKAYRFYAGTPVIGFETTFFVEDGDLDKDMFESLHLTLSDGSGLWARVPQGDGVSQITMQGRQGFELEREWLTFGSSTGGVTVAVADHFVEGLFAISDEHFLVSIR